MICYCFTPFLEKLIKRLGLPALPPPPPATRPPRRVLRHQVLPNLETRYFLYAYCDDLKPAITNLWEFILVERVMTLFERSSGCKMHRTAASQKCKFLALGKWQAELTQEMIPHSFFSLSDHLDYIVTLYCDTQVHLCSHKES